MLLQLPPELLEQVLSRCSGKTLAILECVSKDLQAAARRVPLQLHITPMHGPRHDWVQRRKDRVVKLSLRRLGRNDAGWLLRTFENLRVLDVRYTTLNWHLFNSVRPLVGLHGLRRLHLNKVSCGRYWDPPGRVFSFSWLPPSLEWVDITFDDTWTSVCITDLHSLHTVRVHTVAFSPTLYLDVASPPSHLEQLWLRAYGQIVHVDLHRLCADDVLIDCDNESSGILSCFRSVDSLTFRAPKATLRASHCAHLGLQELDAEVRSYVEDVCLSIPRVQVHTVT